MKRVFDSNPMHGYTQFADGVCETIRSVYGTGGGNTPIVLTENPTFSISSFGEYVKTSVAPSLRASGGDNGGGSEVIVLGK